ncbi:MAG: preprotein translocase subunit SecG [Woeseiaceae bacterium]|nr:preprotein translocase subunit SecG [Woeseiaceae bacterium]
MDTIQKAVLIAHTLIAVLIIVLVLLQRGKGADAGAAFGAGASGTVFGARGSASFFSRLTAIFATAFFVSSLTLAYLSSQRSEAPASLLEGAPATESSVEALPADDEPLPSTELPSLDDPQPAPATADELPALPDDADDQTE